MISLARDSIRTTIRFLLYSLLPWRAGGPEIEGRPKGGPEHVSRSSVAGRVKGLKKKKVGNFLKA